MIPLPIAQHFYIVMFWWARIKMSFWWKKHILTVIQFSSNTKTISRCRWDEGSVDFTFMGSTMIVIPCQQKWTRISCPPKTRHSLHETTIGRHWDPWPVVFLDWQEPSEMIPEDSRPPLPSYFTFSERVIFTMTEQRSNYWLFLSVFIPHK